MQSAPQPLIMISAGWPAAEWELSAAGNFRRRGRVNVRDNTVADRQAAWSLWLLASLIETDALLSCWGTPGKWRLESTEESAASKVADFCLIISSGSGGVRCCHLAAVTSPRTAGIDWTWDSSVVTEALNWQYFSGYHVLLKHFSVYYSCSIILKLESH